jgi:hypothetical protein
MQQVLSAGQVEVASGQMITDAMDDDRFIARLMTSRNIEKRRRKTMGFILIG